MPIDFSAFGGAPAPQQRKSRLNFSAFGQSEQDVAETTATPSTPSTFERVKAAVPEPVRNTVSKVFDYLGRPGAATAGFVAGALSDAPGVEGSAIERAAANLTGSRRDDFDQVLEEQGFEDGALRHVAGFAGDLVLDPTNLLGVGAVKNTLKGAAAAAKLPEAAKFVKGAAVAADTALGGHGAAIVEDLAKKFVPYHGLPEEFARDRRLLDAELGTIDDRKMRELRERFAGTDPQFRAEVAQDIEAGAGRTAKHDDFVTQHRGVEDSLHQRQVDAGMMQEGQFIPDHVRHDFTEKVAKEKDTRSVFTSNLSKRNKNAISRQDPERTIQEAVAGGAESDLAKIQFRYEKEAERASRVGEFIQDAAAKHGQQLPKILKEGTEAEIKASKAAREAAEQDLLSRGYDVLDLPDSHPLMEKVGDTMFPKAIADNLDALRTPRAERGKVGKIIDKAMGMWRTQATVLRPAHHATNFAGNTFNAGLGGLVNPARYWESGTWHLIDPATKIGKYTKGELDDFMSKTGLGQWHTNNFTAELGDVDHANALVRAIESDAKGTTKLGKAVDAAKHPIQTAKKVGSEIENFSKRALFIDQIHKGKSVEEAFEHTQKFLFNYSELTDFEKRYMRAIIPFYTWMRKNIPLQAEMVVKQPHAFAAVGKTKSAIENVSGERGTRTPEAFRPEYLQEANAIQLPTEKGQPKQYLTPYLPFQDLNLLPTSGKGIEQALRQLGGSVNPLIKIPAELASNKNLFFGTKLYNEDAGITGDTQALPASLEALPEAVKDILFNEVRLKGGKTQHEMSFLPKYALQQSPLGESVGKATQAVTNPDEAKNPFSMEAFLTGVRRTQRTPQQEAQDRKYAITGAKRKRTEENKQRPISKSRLEAIKKLYSGN